MQREHRNIVSLIVGTFLFAFVPLAQANSGVLYAATSKGVFRSADGGATWSPANSGLEGLSVFSLAMDPNNAATVYAGTLGRGVFKSTNSGQSWTTASAGLVDTIILSLAIDRTNTSTLYAGTATSAFFPGSQVFKSTDGGSNWIAAKSGLPAAIIEVVAIDPTNPSIIYAGTNFTGVFKSGNGGLNWTAASAGLSGLVMDLAADPASPATVYAATTQGVFKTANAGMNWTALNSGITDLQVVSLAVDPKSHEIVYAGTRANGVFKSVNGGASWSSMDSALVSTLSGIPHLPLLVDPASPATVYAGTVNGVYKSTNGGMNWDAANTGLPAETTVFTLAIEAAVPPLPVAIDVKPRSARNSIHGRSHRRITVAVRSSDSINATSLDVRTIRFGATGIEAEPVHSSLRDLDGDGDLDLILKFRIRDTQIFCGAHSAVLTGKTLAGSPIRGIDSIRTAECR